MSQTILSQDCLALSDVIKAFTCQAGATTVLNKINYQFDRGVSYAVTGASGSGKSTLLHLLAGFEPPDSGAVLWHNKRISELSTTEHDQFVAQYLGFVFQFHYLIKELTVQQNVSIAGLIQGLSGAEADQQSAALFAAVQVNELSQRYPHQISGGQQQRVAIARALMGSPHFILADEPTGNLDQDTGAQVLDVLCAQQKERNVGLIIATHDAAVCERMDVVLEVHNGRLAPR